MGYAIATEKITKQYKNRIAVDNVNIKVPYGEIYGLIGKNGAGKTTIMKMISGLNFPTKGEYLLFGEKRRNTEKIGVLIENPGICQGLTAFENIKIKCILKGIHDERYILELLDLVGLENSKKKVKNYSLGMRQRLGIALALVGNPEILVLDEPTNGLDPEGIAQIRDVICRLNSERNMTILISSHLLDELSKVVTMVGILKDGKLIQEFSKRAFEEKATTIMEFSVDRVDEVESILRSMSIEKYKIFNMNNFQIQDKNLNPEKLIGLLYVNKIMFSNVNIKKQSLEDYYLSLVGYGDEKN